MTGCTSENGEAVRRKEHAGGADGMGSADSGAAAAGEVLHRRQ